MKQMQFRNDCNKKLYDDTGRTVTNNPKLIKSGN